MEVHLGGAKERDGLLVAPGDEVLGCSTEPVYDDLAVIGVDGGVLACDTPTSCILSGGVDPLFVAEYFNGDRSSVLQPEAPTAIGAPPAFDEGGNFIRPQFGPLTLYVDVDPGNGQPGDLIGDYHILSGSAAHELGIDLTGTYPELLKDFDLEVRPDGLVDIGADEYYAPLVPAAPEGKTSQSRATTRSASGRRAGAGN